MSTRTSEEGAMPSENSLDMDAEIEYQHEKHHLRPNKWRRRLVRLYIICTVTWGTLDLTHRAWEAVQARMLQTDLAGLDPCNICGHGPDEATARGCRFDMLKMAWLPPRCMDEELVAEFQSSGPGPNGSWTFYWDKAGTQPVGDPDATIPALWGTQVWATYEWHVTHCIYTWINDWRALYEGKFQVDGQEGERHIRHCGEAMLAQRPFDEVNTRIDAKASAPDGDSGLRVSDWLSSGS